MIIEKLYDFINTVISLGAQVHGKTAGFNLKLSSREIHNPKFNQLSKVIQEPNDKLCF